MNMVETSHGTLEEIGQRLCEALPEGAGVTGVIRLSGGHSNETYMIEGIDQVLRLPPSGALLLETAFDVSGQHAVLQELGDRGCLPVPGLTHFDPDGAMLGAPCFLMKRLPGQARSD